MPSRVRLGPALAALAVLLVILAARVRAARAWVDVNVERDDVRVSIDRAGAARVEHRITLKIGGGPLRTLDVRGADRDAVPDPDGYIVPAREAAHGSLSSAIPITAELMPPDAKPQPDGSPAPPILRLRLGEKGVSRGVYVVLVRYTTRLGGRIAPDGGLTRVEWRGPIWNDGLDAARVTFDLPAAPTEPRPADVVPREPEGTLGAPAREPLVLSTVRRGAAKDEIELMRPYAPKGEAILWAIRVDTRALAPRSLPAARGPSPAATPLGPTPRVLMLAGGLALLLGYAILVALKSREVARASAAADVAPRPLVPLPTWARSLLAGAALAAGVGAELVLGKATIGAILVVIACALAAHRTPLPRRGSQLRGPGRWLSVAEAEAFRAPPRPSGAALDVSTRAGKAVLAALLAAVFGAAWFVGQDAPYLAALVALDATALLAVFCTGRLSELPPDPAAASALLLRAIAKRLAKPLAGKARVVGRIRVPEGSAAADELRLVIAPRAGAPGIGAIEVGVIHARGPGGWIALPEVLLRITAGSPAETALEDLAKTARASRGRRPAERVLAFAPRFPTARMTAALVARLVAAVAATAPRVAPARSPSRRAA